MSWDESCQLCSSESETKDSNSSLINLNESRVRTYTQTNLRISSGRTFLTDCNFPPLSSSYPPYVHYPISLRTISITYFTVMFSNRLILKYHYVTNTNKCQSPRPAYTVYFTAINSPLQHNKIPYLIYCRHSHSWCLETNTIQYQTRFGLAGVT